jgi:hypothetical protein
MLPEKSRLWRKTPGCPSAWLQIGRSILPQRSVSARPIFRAGLSRRPPFLRLAWFTSALLLWATLSISHAAPIAFVQVNAATPQTTQSKVAVKYAKAQAAGDTNILAIGWNNATSNITSVTDSMQNTYQLAVTTARGNGLSQTIYYAKNIKAAAAGKNTVTVTFNTATPYIDLRGTEYSGLDPTDPLDAGHSASGRSATADSRAVTTTTATELVFGAGMTTGAFSAAGTNFTSRIITSPDADIVEDRSVTATEATTLPLHLDPQLGSCRWQLSRTPQVVVVVGRLEPTSSPTTMTYSGRGGIPRKPSLQRRTSTVLPSLCSIPLLSTTRSMRGRFCSQISRLAGCRGTAPSYKWRQRRIPSMRSTPRTAPCSSQGI